MTYPLHEPGQRHWAWGILLVAGLGCLSIEPLSSYSSGGPPVPAAAGEPELAASEPTAPEPEATQQPEPEPEGEPVVSEGLPGDGEIVLDPMLQPEPAPTEPEPPAGCAGPGEFASSDGQVCYLRSTQNAVWVDAATSCQSWGGGLVIIDSREEDAFLGEHIDVSIWIGASDFLQEGRMLWNGGAPLAFSNWALGEPNDFQGREDCAVKAMPAGSWNDLPCRNLNSYVCERGLD